jgi:hypothetical protein
MEPLIPDHSNRTRGDVKQARTGTGDPICAWAEADSLETNMRNDYLLPQGVPTVEDVVTGQDSTCKALPARVSCRVRQPPIHSWSALEGGRDHVDSQEKCAIMRRISQGTGGEDQSIIDRGRRCHSPSL